MRTSFNAAFALATWTACTSAPLAIALEPQQPMEFRAAAEGTFAADWEGVAARTYFMQWSFDFQTWFYCPMLAFGGGEHSFGITKNADVFFVRLRYGDFPGITSLEEAMIADFDNDGLSNIFEVMNGFDPLTANANADAEEDGLLLTSEQQYATSPHRRDHPAVKLSVVIGN